MQTIKDSDEVWNSGWPLVSTLTDIIVKYHSSTMPDTKKYLKPKYFKAKVPLESFLMNCSLAIELLKCNENPNRNRLIRCTG